MEYLTEFKRHLDSFDKAYIEGEKLNIDDYEYIQSMQRESLDELWEYLDEQEWYTPPRLKKATVFNLYEYKGKQYRLAELCSIFWISYNALYKKLNVCTIQDLINNQMENECTYGNTEFHPPHNWPWCDDIR